MVMDETLLKIRDVIVETVHPDKIILFGSRAKGTNRDDSDYDIFILKEGIDNERDITRAARKALYNHNIIEDIDLLASSPDKFEKNKDNKYMIYKDVATQGVTLYG